MKKATTKGASERSVKSAAKVTYAPFDVADYLDSGETIAEYLRLAARDDNPGVLLKAVGDVANARGKGQHHRSHRFNSSTIQD